MANNNCSKFRKNQSISKNQTIELLNQLSQSIDNTNQNPKFIEAKRIIKTLENLYNNDPSSFKMAPETYLGLEKLKELFPESQELCKEIWNQIPVFNHSNNSPIDNYYSGDCFDDYDTSYDEGYNI